jgi:UPF0716 protein FxsA
MDPNRGMAAAGRSRNGRPPLDVEQDMKRRFSWWLLLLAFVAVPVIEIYVIIQIGQVIGAWWTILLLVADSIFGTWLVKREGSRAWRALSAALEERRMPARELADGVLILVGGTLMLTPGFVTDFFGILCILPLTRPLGRRVLAGVISRRLGGVSFPAGPRSQPDGPDAGARTQQRPGPGDPDNRVVQGEVVDERPQEGTQPPPQ